MADKAVVVIGAGPLTPEEVVRVARDRARVEVAPAARAAVAASWAALEQIARSGRPVYGLSTGVGADCEVSVPLAEQAEFQRQLLLSHAVNVGPPVREEWVRAMMFVRAAGMARGGSGVQPAVFELLVEMLNRGVHPVVATHGSLGAADIGPLAQMALPLIGLGAADYDGHRLPGREALRRAGLEPIRLKAKDGLALCSSNAATLGLAALLLADTDAVLELFDLTAALSLEAFQGNVSPLDPRVHAAKPHTGQVETAARLRRLLAGSYLWQPGCARRVQDPLSFRCVPQVHGAVREVLAQLRSALTLELNSATDNPLVLAQDQEAISNGNFHIPQIAIGLDALGIALAQAATLLSYRTMKLADPGFTELPGALSARPGVDSGLGILHYTITHLTAEVRRCANPASLDFLPVGNGQEDHATMASIAVTKLETALGHLRYLGALELHAAAQAIDLRGRPALGRGTGAAYARVRSAVPMHIGDRVISEEVETLHALVRSGEILRSVRVALDSPGIG